MTFPANWQETDGSSGCAIPISLSMIGLGVFADNEDLRLAFVETVFLACGLIQGKNRNAVFTVTPNSIPSSTILDPLPSFHPIL